MPLGDFWRFVMLEPQLKDQLAGYMQRLQRPIELVASLDDSSAALELRELLQEVSTLSDKISVREDGAANRRPSFAVTCPG